MPYDNGGKMGSYGGRSNGMGRSGKMGGVQKGFMTVRYGDRGEPKGEQYWGSQYGTGSVRTRHGHSEYPTKGRY